MTDPYHNWLQECLARLPQARVGVFGDFCLDAYWLIDPDEGELSVETALPVRRVRRQRYSPGGAGNVATNLAALGVAEVRAVGLAGEDLFGRRLLALLEGIGVDTEGMLTGGEGWQTMVYAKPCVGERELNRIDFGTFNEISSADIDALAERLDAAAGECDAVVLNQQVPRGVSVPAMIQRINDVIAAHPACTFLVDSRHRPQQYRGAALKVNAREAAALCVAPEATVGAQPVFITRGANGILVVAADGMHEVAGIGSPGPVDPVGAGDTVAAALAAALGSGSDPVTAARLANLAAAVTVRKLQTTGAATPDEIRRIAAEAPAG